MSYIPTLQQGTPADDLGKAACLNRALRRLYPNDETPISGNDRALLGNDCLFLLPFADVVHPRPVGGAAMHSNAQLSHVNSLSLVLRFWLLAEESITV